jgi:hypothetical protein
MEIEELVLLFEPLIPLVGRLIGAIFIYMLTDDVKRKTKKIRKAARNECCDCHECELT